MESRQVLNATDQAVSILLSLRWRRVNNTNSGPHQFSNWQYQCFEFLKPDGTVACTVEFEHTEFDEGDRSLWGRKGKIVDNQGVVIIEDRDLVDTHAKPNDHPLNDLHDMLWDKESGQGKFPETVRLEKFIETLKA